MLPIMQHTLHPCIRIPRYHHLLKPRSQIGGLHLRISRNWCSSIIRYLDQLDRQAAHLCRILRPKAPRVNIDLVTGRIYADIAWIVDLVVFEGTWTSIEASA